MTEIFQKKMLHEFYNIHTFLKHPVYIHIYNICILMNM